MSQGTETFIERLPGRVRRAPRTIASRGRTYVERYRYARRPSRPPTAIVADALRDGRDLAEFLQAFRSRPTPRYFLGVADADATVAFLTTSVDGWSERVLDEADRICSG